MRPGLEQLLGTLLYEGYALYPYTPGAAKNSTPTPFGIVYPPAYAAGSNSTFDHARLECLAVLDPQAQQVSLSAELHYLTPSGERHEAAPQKVKLGPLAPGDAAQHRLRRRPHDAALLGARTRPPLRARLRCITTSEVEPDLDRQSALTHSLISTHIVVEITGGRFVSPLDAGLDSVNTFPVLASDTDDVVLGTTIMLPDHPRLAPESLGSLFDSTEIEEALLLHVQVLSDEERAEIEQQDPAVREMIEAAETATPDRDPGATRARDDARPGREGEDRHDCVPAMSRCRRGGKVVA